MANKIPVKAIFTGGDVTALGEFEAGDTIPGSSTSFSATDKLLGRSSAGAGAGEEITCTSAARSILDDASVAAILTTLGGMAYSDSRFKVGSLNRDGEASSGSVAYTGVGFQPKFVFFLALIDNSLNTSVGYSDVSNNTCMVQKPGPVWGQATTYCIFALTDNENWQAGAVSAFGSDGFTIAWTKTGAGSVGTITVMYAALR